MREISVDNLIKRDLDSFGANVYWRKKHANKYQKNGTADYYGTYKGKYISIEAKAGNGHPLSMAQLFDGYQVVRAGGAFVVAFPDYTSFLKAERHKMTFDFSYAQKANELLTEDYSKLESLCKTINKNKKTMMFY